jgi:pimeloyl-ACP methyl ester carboxylesterase
MTNDTVSPNIAPVTHAGHNLPQEEPKAFAGAVMELIKA